MQQKKNINFSFDCKQRWKVSDRKETNAAKIFKYEVRRKNVCQLKCYVNWSLVSDKKKQKKKKHKIGGEN